MADYSKGEATDWARENLRGQWTTLMTPFTPDDEVDEEGLRRNIRHIRKLGTRGAGCTWGMGEFWSLTHDERLRVYDIVAGEANGEWPIGAHVTHTSAREMLALADHAEAVGFDLLIVAAPYMVTRTEQQVIDFTRLLADHTPLAIMFYNSPQFGTVLSVEGLRGICEIPNVVGVKEASFNQQLSIDAHVSLGQRIAVVVMFPPNGVFGAQRRLRNAAMGRPSGHAGQVEPVNARRITSAKEGTDVVQAANAVENDADREYPNAIVSARLFDSAKREGFHENRAPSGEPHLTTGRSVASNVVAAHAPRYVPNVS